jgi:hypothetical protein
MAEKKPLVNSSGVVSELSGSDTIPVANYPTMVGDSGAGGTKGAVPAPSAGDAAASKFLKADGTWATAGGGSSPLTTKGDIHTFSTVDARLAVGTNGLALIAASGEATGLKWGMPSVNLTETTVDAPTGTSNTTGVMMGLAGSITTGASTSGIVQVIISGAVTNNTASSGWKYQIRYGTGTAPTNGAALTGTTAGYLTAGTLGTGTNKAIMPFCIVAKIPSLSASTTYWIDLSLAAGFSGTATLTDVCINAEEK